LNFLVSYFSFGHGQCLRTPSSSTIWCIPTHLVMNCGWIHECIGCVNLSLRRFAWPFFPDVCRPLFGLHRRHRHWCGIIMEHQPISHSVPISLFFFSDFMICITGVTPTDYKSFKQSVICDTDLKTFVTRAYQFYYTIHCKTTSSLHTFPFSVLNNIHDGVQAQLNMFDATLPLQQSLPNDDWEHRRVEARTMFLQTGDAEKTLFAFQRSVEKRERKREK
jgi:hypothetical protein